MGSSDNSTPHLSSAYDAQVRATIPYYDMFHQETLNLIAAAKPHPVLWLDTGCGTGTMVEKALKRFPVTRFLLADPSVEMLNEAKTKLAAISAERIELFEATPTQNLHLPVDRRPDVITAIQSHHYLSKEDRHAATLICFEILNEGGVYVTFENIRPASKEGTAIGLGNWANFQCAAGKEPDAVRKHMARFGVEYFPITVAEHLGLLQTCGFRTVELFWLSHMQAGFYGVK